MGQLLDVFDALTEPSQTPSARWSALRIPPEVQAQRDAEARAIVSREALPNGGGAIPSSSVVSGTTERYNNALAGKGGELLQAFDNAINSSQEAQQQQQINVRLQSIPVPLPMGQNNPPTGYQEPSLGQKILGSPEAALSMATNAIATPIAAWGAVLGAPFDSNRNPDARYRAILDTLTYQPRTEAGKAATEAAGSILEASKLGGMGPTEGMAMAGASALARPRVSAARPQQAIAAAPQASIGAAGADVATQARAMAAAASPQIQQAVEDALKKSKGNINLQSLDRHIQADSLPVPIPLTKGQATGDIVMLSNEMNKRAQNSGEVAQFLNQQNKALVENTSRIRESAAPDVFVSSRPAVGEMIIDAYRAKDAALNREIAGKYKALKDANGGQFPLHAQAFVNTADDALHKQLLYDHVPPQIRATMERLKSQGSTVGGGMTFENFENLRTQLARIQRSPTADGNARAAAGVIRQELENLPMPPGAEHLKPLADQARAAAKARFDLIEGDPAYKAVVNGKASADKFIDRYIVGSDTKNVQTMRNNLSHDVTAQQAMSAGAMDFLRRQAGVIGDQSNFSQAGYNKALEGLRPKLNYLFNPQDKANIDRLGNVARWTQEQPRGSFVNNSNTFTAAMGEKAANLLEGSANLIVPYAQIGSMVRQATQKAKATKELRDMLAPGAGIVEKK